MLGKLFKHDFKSTMRFGIPMLIAIAAVCVAGSANAPFMISLMSQTETSAGIVILSLLSFFLEMLVVIALVAIPTIILVIVLMDYYKSTVSDEAYLTFTLPVTPTQILVSKLLNAVLWSAIMTVASVIAGILISFFTTLAEDAFYPGGGYEESVEGIGYSGTGAMIVLLIAYAAVTVVVQILMYFMAISFSSSITRKNKGLAAIGFAFIANTIYGVVNYIIIIVAVIIGVVAGIEVDNPFVVINTTLAIMTAASIGFGVLFFFLTRRILERKLNLS